MIALNELRLNNWVYSPEVGSNVQITLLSNDNWLGLSSVTWDQPSCEEIEPITLTEEILLKCGFEARGYFWFDLYLDERTKLTLGWHPDGRIDFEMSINKIYFDISHIKHLHQLQNLYFSLTNKELEIKLQP